MNMTPGWEYSEPEKRYCVFTERLASLVTSIVSFLHRLFLAMDANFRLKRRNVSSEAKDPSYSAGWSYFVPEKEYKEFLAEYDSVVVQSVSVHPVIICCPLTSILAEHMLQSSRRQQSAIRQKSCCDGRSSCGLQTWAQAAQGRW